MIASLEKHLGTLYIILLPCLILVPQWDPIDIKALIWLNLSIVNTVFILYILFVYRDKSHYYLKDPSIILFFCFFLVSILSTSVAINKAASLMRLTDIYAIFSSLIIIVFFNKRGYLDHKTVLIIIFISLILELAGSYYQLYQVYYYNGEFSNTNSGDVKSVYPNKNMTSFALAPKTMLVLILHSIVNNKWMKLFILIILIASCFIIILLASRAMYFLIPMLAILYLLLLLTKKFFKGKEIIPDISFLKYFFVSFIVSLLIYKITIDNKNTDNIQLDIAERAVSVFNSTDESAANRIRFIKHTVDQIKKKPLLGIGIGNWRLKSIEYDKEDLYSYVVPHSAHNDFLEIFAETGIFGFSSFFLFFLFLLKKIMEGIKLWLNDKLRPYSIYILSAFLLLLADFTFNFPLDRPSSMIVFLLLVSVIYSAPNKNYKIEK